MRKDVRALQVHERGIQIDPPTRVGGHLPLSPECSTQGVGSQIIHAGSTSPLKGR